MQYTCKQTTKKLEKWEKQMTLIPYTKFFIIEISWNVNVKEGLEILTLDMLYSTWTYESSA